jgi:hypothetical protein
MLESNRGCAIGQWQVKLSRLVCLSTATVVLYTQQGRELLVCWSNCVEVEHELDAWAACLAVRVNKQDAALTKAPHRTATP